MEQLTEFVSKSFTSERLPLSNIVASTTTSPSTTVTSSLTSTTFSNNPFPANFGSFSFFRNHPSHNHFSNAFPSSSALHSMVDRLSNGVHPHFPPLHFFTSQGHLPGMPFHTSHGHFSRGSNFPPVDLTLGTASLQQKLTSTAATRDRSRSPGSASNKSASRTSLTDDDSRQSLDPDGISADGSETDARSSSSGKGLVL